MPKKNENLDNKINKIIDELQNLDTSEMERSSPEQQNLINFSNILSNISKDPELAIGTEIGQWKILGLLGIGGMSIVYLVERNDEQLKQKAALKIIPNIIASKNMIERFVRERQILSDLNHNNIAKLYDAGVTEHNIPWLVMELVEGEDIITFSNTHDLNIEQRVILFKQICEALAYAHANGVIHRDIKPTNLMVNHDKILKLLDFGIASVEEQQSLTMTGAIIGTPGYMSPEQAKGISSELDRRTDIFSLGVLLYKLIKHKMPFEADNISEISYKIIHDEPTTLGSVVPVELKAIIFKCLEKRVENRYASASSLNQDLNAYLNGDVVSARNITFLGRVKKKIIKHPFTSTFVTIAALTTIMGVGFGMYQVYASLKKIQMTENYLSRSQEIKAKVRRTHMMPLHNIRSEYAEISHDIEQLKNEIENTHADASGLSDFALGSAYLTMRKKDIAYDYLAKAFNKGWKSYELSGALGLILAYKWDDAKRHSLSISNKEERQEYLDKKQIEIYQPAVKHLKNAQKGLSISNFISAYLASLDNDIDKAIEFIEKEIVINPWYYEALILASDLYIRKAIPILSSQGYQQAKGYINLSKERMDQAINIGRSDPYNYKEYCSNFGFEIQYGLTYHADSFLDIFNQGIAICKKALKLSPLPKPASIYMNIHYLYENNALYQQNQGFSSFDLFKKSYETIKQGLKLYPNDSELLKTSVASLVAMAKHNISINKNPDHFFKSAVTNIEKSLSINPNSRKSWHRLAILQKELGNYYRNIKKYQLADKHYHQSLDNHNKVTELGNKLSGLANGALVINERAKLKFLLGKPLEGIDLFRKALTASEEIFKFNQDVFVTYTNYYEYQYDLIKALDTNNMPFVDELSKAINSINDGCNFDYLKDNHINMVEISMNLFIENNYAKPQQFNACQIKKELLKKN